jgi:AcrR family transcriptional regulator
MSVPEVSKSQEGRRHQLIDTALALFAEKGYENATIKDLAEACGVAPGLVYHYFESKEDLLLSVFEKHGFVAELERVLLPSFDRPASEVLAEVVKGYYDLLVERESFVRMIVRESMTNPKLEARWTTMCSTGVQLLAQYLSARVAAGELRPHDTEISARMLTHPVVVLRLTGGSADNLSSIVDCLLNGIVNRSKNTGMDKI